jgi:cell division septation protein DedD
MDSTQDTEITLGTAKLLALFFGLVMVCAVFFALGYTLGRKSDAGLTTTAAAASPLNASSGSKPASSATQAAQPMTFYKAVEQKDANAQLTPASEAVSTSTVAAEATPPASSSAGQEAAAQTNNPPDPMVPVAAGNYFVQVAAVSKEEDAQSLVDALKKKQYPAFVATAASTDKLFRVQLGPFGDIKDAEGMRTRLINDGYNPILKK